MSIDYTREHPLGRWTKDGAHFEFDPRKVASGSARDAKGETVDALDELFFDYIAHANPKSNEHLKRYLRLYPQFREEIIDFTANWRALSILEKVLPPAPTDAAVERQMLRRAEARLRALRRRRTGEKTSRRLRQRPDKPGKIRHSAR